MKALIAELKRRNVIRVGIFYAAGAWLILQVADVVLEIVDAPDGSLRLIALILAFGFPFALVLAWAFEITPEGIKRESEVDRSQPALDRSARKLDLATIAVVSLAIVLLLWDNFGHRPGEAPVLPASQLSAPETAAEEPRDLSIAVLPFVNMSPDPDNEYFSEGLSEEVLNVLARIQDFRVAGRTSSFAFKDQRQDLRAIGERLGVANILEGSVRKQGERVRVTAQLIDARSGYHLWSDTYDRQLHDVFAIQDEIATEVVRALRLTLLDADAAVIGQTAKGDVEAYNHYLRGQAHVRLRTRSGLERALEEFQQAILIDPGYAPSYAGIAMVYALFDNYGYRSLTETGELAHRALDRALALDPHSDEAWSVRGLLLGQGPGAPQRRAEARAALERAIAINPNNAFAHLWLSGTLLPDFEAARRALHRAYDLDPLSPVIVYRRAIDAVQWRDEAAFERFEGELREVAPDWFITWQLAGTAAQEAGRLAEAALAYERAVELNPDYLHSLAPLGMILEMLGYEAEAEAMLERALRFNESEDFRVLLAALHTRRALREEDHAAALAIYRPAIEALESPPGERVAEVAMLEIGAGQPAAAEQRLRVSLGIEPGSFPGPLEDPDLLLQHLSMAVALVERRELEEAAPYFGVVREMFEAMKAQGVSFNYMPLAEGMMAHFEGRTGALRGGMEESIHQGFRAPPANLRWMLPLEPRHPDLVWMTEVMKELLAEERRRYDAAKAGG
jgi:TolB-like protein/tetratricopeptide (TPR) repeat protein